MCSIDSELVVKLEPEIVTSFNANDFSKRKCFRVKIDVLSNHIAYGFEIVNIKSRETDEVRINEFIISKIAPNSPADKVNLRKDDRIIEINGHMVTKMSISEIQFLIKESNRSYDGHLDILVGNIVHIYFLKLQV